ncbi:MAG: hypothetical protein J6I47_10190 [Ruminococcus sp.]|nr:hypothetical protein [Ruminococcus sp.]
MKETTHDYFGKMMNEIIKSEEEDNESPYTEGETAAYTAYSESEYLKSNEFEVAKLPKLNGIANFVKTLRKADVDTIAITDSGPDVLSYIHRLVECGCKIEGLCTVHREIVDNPALDLTTDFKGIRIRL